MEKNIAKIEAHMADLPKLRHCKKSNFQNWGNLGRDPLGQWVQWTWNLWPEERWLEIHSATNLILIQESKESILELCTQTTQGVVSITIIATILSKA